MPVYKIARYEVRPDARDEAERVMREFADYVRRELPSSTWTMYRDPHAPTHYVSMIRIDDLAADKRHRDAPGTRAFDAALAPLLVGDIDVRDCELVTSSDLQRRSRPQRR